MSKEKEIKLVNSTDLQVKLLKSAVNTMYRPWLFERNGDLTVDYITTELKSIFSFEFEVVKDNSFEGFLIRVPDSSKGICRILNFVIKDSNEVNILLS
jgi:hypothetical protein